MSQRAEIAGRGIVIGHAAGGDGVEARNGLEQLALAAACEKAGVTADTSVEDACDMIIAAMQEIQVEGLTGTMTWDAAGTVTKTPTAVVIKDGAYVSAE